MKAELCLIGAEGFGLDNPTLRGLHETSVRRRESAVESLTEEEKVPSDDQLL
jgi:hypothetical protein